MVSAPLDLPRLVLAAPTSGAGKTTVTTGLMAALRARGLRVSPHKVGPDYIDPGYHALATGRPGRNLDAVLCGPARLAPLFAHGATGADIAVVEGVMGLFDGVARPQPGEAADHASTAHVARLLDAPVILVVDVSGAARSLAALVAGFRAFDRRLHLAGVILNRVGSPRHRELLTEALADIGIAVFGAVPREQAVHTPSRHLGLVPAAERRPAAVDAVDRLGALIAASCDLDGLLRVARAAPPLRTDAWDPTTALALAAAGDAAAADTSVVAAQMGDAAVGEPRVAGAAGGRPVRVAVAGGAAFTFGYAEHVELLTAAGAHVVVVDPLRDDTLPAGTDALIIGGGFPEEHVGALTANTRLRAEIAAFAARGAPVVAECAGLLYLARSLDGAPMCAVLDVDAVMGPRLTLGYRRAVAATSSPLAPAGSALSAHEFHRTVLLPPPAGSPPPAWLLPVVDPAPAAQLGRHGRFGRPGRPGAEPATRWLAEGFLHRRVHASYLHLHWAGRPQIAVGLLAAAHTSRRDHPTGHHPAGTRHPGPQPPPSPTAADRARREPPLGHPAAQPIRPCQPGHVDPRGMTDQGDEIDPPAERVAADGWAGADGRGGADLVVGVGARPGVDAGELLALIAAALRDLDVPPRAVRLLATVAARRGEPGIIAAAHHHHWPVTGYPPQRLATVDVPHPSAAAQAALGIPGVAEAACLLPIDPQPDPAAPRPILLLPKRAGRRATIAVARHPTAARPTCR